MSSNKTGSHGAPAAAPLMNPGTTGPAMPVVVFRNAVSAADGGRLKAELDGGMAIGTQVLIVDAEGVQAIDTLELSVLANAATRLHDEHSGSIVLPMPSARLLGQLRAIGHDPMFELEVEESPAL